MKALIQRVSEASVGVEGEEVARIGEGVLVLLGIDKGDAQADADQLLEKLLAFRIFPDASGKMNLSVREVEGGILLVSQFTLSADTRKGSRPSFTAAAPPLEARALYEYFLRQLSAKHLKVASGVFGADMKVALVNDGPVTFIFESH